MSFAIASAVIAGTLAMVVTGLGLAVLALSDRKAGGPVELTVGTRAIWRLRVMLCLAAAAAAFLAGFALFCSRV